MCNRLTAVTLPAGVTSIGKQAFYQCDGLTEMHLPPGFFKVASQPSAKGTRNAIIRVASNDSSENTFEIRVTGAGAAE